VSEIAVPDIGEFDDVPVVEILVATGDSVAEGDALVVIESDKATMEIPAPSGGVVLEILVAVGDRVSEGSPIVRIDSAGESSAGGALDPAERQNGQPDPLEPAQSQPAVAGEQDGMAAGPAPNVGAPARDDAHEHSEVYAGPAVRRRARERGIDLSAVSGSGRRGRITLEDVDRVASLPTGACGDGLQLGGLAPWPTVDFAGFGEIERVPLTRIQRLSGANLARNWVTIPHVTHDEDADITELEAFRRLLNQEQSEVKVTMVALVLKAVAVALRSHPQLNASLDGEELVLRRYYNLGFAADTPGGLVVPVVRDVHGKGLLELAGEIAELSARARAGRLSPAAMSGGTFTISSLGGIGGTSFTPIINAPEVAILGVVRSVMRPVWDGRAFRPRLILPMSLSYDHRVIDGAAAARFCAHLAALLSDMRRLLL
jgi:pyruvate dehydrogenase E2 component (dihydrolipoamide acetyltransferase)